MTEEKNTHYNYHIKQSIILTVSTLLYNNIVIDLCICVLSELNT